MFSGIFNDPEDDSWEENVKNSGLPYFLIQLGKNCRSCCKISFSESERTVTVSPGFGIMADICNHHLQAWSESKNELVAYELIFDGYFYDCNSKESYDSIMWFFEQFGDLVKFSNVRLTKCVGPLTHEGPVRDWSTVHDFRQNNTY